MCVEWRLCGVQWCPDHLENSIISPLHAIKKHRRTHTDTHVCVLSSIADSSAEKVRPVGSISGRALLDFSDVLQRSQRSPLEWMPLTLHHQTGLSFCVFVYVRCRLERRADKSNLKKPPKAVLVNVFWITIFTKLEPPSLEHENVLAAADSWHLLSTSEITSHTVGRHLAPLVGCKVNATIVLWGLILKVFPGNILYQPFYPPTNKMWM